MKTLCSHIVKMKFEDIYNIHHYDDGQVKEIISSLLNDKDLLNLVSKVSPGVIKYLPNYFSQKITRNFLKKTFKESIDIKSFQENLALQVELLISKTTDSFTVSGLENFNSNPTLYISNHRDIALDSLLLNYTRFKEGRKTLRIAIGDNLINGKFSEKVMRLNKSFVVFRRIQGIKETYRKLINLSTYINKSLKEDNESIWIAQLQGRATDGNDITELAVLKMLYLSERKSKDISSWLEEVNLSPVTISYEYDPLDTVKAIGWDGWENLSFEENNKRDIDELMKGLLGKKGRIHLHIGSPIKNCDSLEQVASEIDKSMLDNYKVWDSVSISDSIITGKSEKELSLDYDPIYIDNFLARFKFLNQDLKEKALRMYAAPLINKRKGQH